MGSGVTGRDWSAKGPIRERSSSPTAVEKQAIYLFVKVLKKISSASSAEALQAAFGRSQLRSERFTALREEASAHLHAIRAVAQIDDETHRDWPSSAPSKVDEDAVSLLLAALVQLQEPDDEPLGMYWPEPSYHTPSQAARAGFLDGLLDSISLDVFGDDELLTARAFKANQSAALQQDWDHVAGDFRAALAKVYEQLQEELAELTERQGTLFNPDQIEPSVESR
jgi:hypothetical protein